MLQRVCVALLLLALPSAALASQSIRVSPGERVRVTIALQRTVGTVRAVAAESLTVEPDGGGAWYGMSTSEIRRLEVSLGMRRRAGIGAVVGLFAGMAVGGAAATGSDDDYAAIGGVTLGALLGTAVGAGVGTATLVERWRVVYNRARSSAGRASLAIVVPDGGAAAWDTTIFRTGRRIQIKEVVDGERLTTTGTIAAVRGDSLVVRPSWDDSLWSVARDQVKTLRLSVGMKRHPIRGAAIGSVVGGLVDVENERGMQFVGLAVGGLLGWLMKSEQWVDERDDGRARVGVVPRSGGGFAVAVSFAF